MSNKTTRAIINRALRTKYTGVQAERPHAIKRKVIFPYAQTKAYLRTFERYSWRARIAREHDGQRLARQVKAIIEQYETYKLRKHYAHKKQYTLGEYIRQYARHLPYWTPQLGEEVKAWYDANGKTRVSRMRKMHAIVGTSERPILRTE